MLTALRSTAEMRVTLSARPASRWWQGVVQIEDTAFDVATQRLSYTNVNGVGGGKMGACHWERLVRA